MFKSINNYTYEFNTNNTIRITYTKSDKSTIGIVFKILTNELETLINTIHRNQNKLQRAVLDEIII